jgi:hypothetical protein
VEVLLLTIFCSLLLASLFTVLFLVERKRRERTGVEQTALLPLAGEGRRRADGKKIQD